MTIFSILKVDDGYSLKKVLRANRDSIHQLFQQSIPVATTPLDGVSVFLYSTSNFEYVYT
jgi:hypothetical protein